MKIVVCVSHVPDTASKINIGSDGKSLDTTGLTFVLNPYDEFAIEEALKTKEKVGGEVILLSVGDDSFKESLRKGLAMGADSAILLKSSSYLDSLSVSKILANEISSLGSELVFLGKQSVDYDNSVIGQMLSELLNFSSVSVAVNFNIDGAKILAEREIEGGKEVVELTLPAVVTTQKGLNEPRYPSLKGIMASKKKVIEEKQAKTFDNYSEFIALQRPALKSAGKIVGTDVTAVGELVRLLREEAKVI
ncbi:MAG: electron transfer flavoprotein subunit beta/FixA family protein [bacterium]